MGATLRTPKRDLVEFIMRQSDGKYGTKSSLLRLAWEDLWRICQSIKYDGLPVYLLTAYTENHYVSNRLFYTMQDAQRVMRYEVDKWASEHGLSETEREEYIELSETNAYADDEDGMLLWTISDVREVEEVSSLDFTCKGSQYYGV